MAGNECAHGYGVFRGRLSRPRRAGRRGGVFEQAVGDFQFQKPPAQSLLSPLPHWSFIKSRRSPHRHDWACIYSSGVLRKPIMWCQTAALFAGLLSSGSVFGERFCLRRDFYRCQRGICAGNYNDEFSYAAAADNPRDRSVFKKIG